MTEWYIPVTLLPGVGLLIMSTSNLMNSLSGELSMLIHEHDNAFHTIIEKKISQIHLLNKSLSSLYISSAAYVLAGLIGGLGTSQNMLVETGQFSLMILGTICVLIGLIWLTQFSYRAVTIKRAQFKLSIELKNKKPQNIEAKQ
ncbi:DUF2721 domain-containing protein [Fulvivirga sp. M361]|uniref:DUF2721 domain-containing protein n=1 Tax=Fulvivirga sp. M361 TaxID=2594266 RepID=UPI00117B919E|nr:DUF2721 domain-containing protein [Fulvivirga sp. M361]TRX57568.1 DUF2721 domain-containing protein [Fulvivirga sp. M361]